MAVEIICTYKTHFITYLSLEVLPHMNIDQCHSRIDSVPADSPLSLIGEELAGVIRLSLLLQIVASIRISRCGGLA